MSEWREYRLDEIGQVVGGGTPSSKVNAYWNGNVGWVTPADLSGYQFKHIGNGSRDITELGLKKSSAKLHPKNTVLMTSRAPIGYLAIADKPVATNQGFQSIRCNEDIADFNFIYYLLGAYKEGIALIASGATFPEVSGGKVRQYKIKLPPLPIQQKIAKILSNYDDLIENNLKRIKLLEESARLTYEEWFLRFRIDGKKLDIDPETSLPFEWEKKKLGDYFPIVTGKKDANIQTNDGKYPFFTCSQGTYKTDVYSFDAEAIILAGNGEFNVKYYRGKFEAYQRNYVLIPDDRNYLFLLFLFMKHYLKEITYGSKGAVIKYLTKDMIENANFIEPAEELLVDFNKLIVPIFYEIENLDHQNQLLKEARDILLPRLMTGMIDTDDMDVAV